jgi:hypothetical protein
MHVNIASTYKHVLFMPTELNRQNNSAFMPTPQHNFTTKNVENSVINGVYINMVWCIST